MLYGILENYFSSLHTIRYFLKNAILSTKKFIYFELERMVVLIHYPNSSVFDVLIYVRIWDPAFILSKQSGKEKLCLPLLLGLENTT